MDWVALALINAFFFGVVSIIDSHLVSRRLPGLPTYFCPVGFTALGSCVAGYFLAPFPPDTPPMVMGMTIGAIVIRNGGYVAMMYAFKKMEVSRVVPVVFSYPVFVAFMSVFLLGEHLGYLQWIAVFLVVGGAVMISFRGQPGSSKSMGKKLLLLFGISLSVAISDTMSKYALSYLDFWNVFTINTGCLSVTAFALSIGFGGYQALRRMRNPFAAVSIGVLGQAIAMGALIAQLLAIQRGPVSLVSTISASRPIFVLIIALILSRAYPVFLDWQKGVRLMVLRFTATAMIFAGIAVIYLT